MAPTADEWLVQFAEALGRPAPDAAEVQTLLQLASVAAQANAIGLSVPFAQQFFRDQINASKIIQVLPTSIQSILLLFLARSSPISPSGRRAELPMRWLPI